MLRKATADKLRDYVTKGGKLVSEGCPGYFGDGGTVGTVQPNLGLDQLFGARETYVQFTPDMLGKLTLTVKENRSAAGISYRNTSWREARRWASIPTDTSPPSSTPPGMAKTLLIGTFPGGSYYRNHCALATRDFLPACSLGRALRQQVQSSDAAVKARLHKGAGGTYLWVVNPDADRPQRQGVAAIRVSARRGPLAGIQPPGNQRQHADEPSKIGTPP